MSHKNLAFLALCSAEFCNSLVFFAPVALLVRTRCGITCNEFFVLQAILSLCVLIFEIPCGFLTDRIGCKKSLVLSQIFLCLKFLFFFSGGNFIHFSVAAFVEALSICLSSGTSESYIYKIFGKGQFVPKSSVIRNFGTAGFILSTLIFIPLDEFFGLPALIFSTFLSSLAALIFILVLPEENERQDFRKKSLVPTGKVIPLLFSKKLISFLGLSGLLSLGVFITNFFFIIKIKETGLGEGIMGGIIIAYSFLQLLSPLILRRIAGLEFRTVLFFLFALIAGTLFILALVRGPFVILPMLFLPLFLSLPGFFLSREQNLFIDEKGFAGERATLLSVLNQGQNASDLVFLFAAGLLPASDVNLIFLFTGGLFLLNGILAVKAFATVKPSSYVEK